MQKAKPRGSFYFYFYAEMLMMKYAAGRFDIAATPALQHLYRFARAVAHATAHMPQHFIVFYFTYSAVLNIRRKAELQAPENSRLS